MPRLLLAAALASGLASLPAQTPDSSRHPVEHTERDLPQQIAVDVASLYNAPAALRATGATEIPAQQTVSGDVTVLRGTLTLGGHVTGRVLVVNGDVLLLPGAEVDSGLIVVGGRITGAERASLGGEVQWYRAPLRYHREAGGERIVADAAREPFQEDNWLRRWRRRRALSTAKLTLKSGTYNRVEGLPVLFGPTVRQNTAWGRVTVDAFGILRSADGFALKEANLGYDANGELRAGRWRGVVVGAHAFDTVDPVEDWQLKDSEIGLASFFLHRDYRDYFNRRGITGSVGLVRGDELELRLSFSSERWGARDTRDPVTLFRNAATWRPNPQLDAGRFHLLNATLTVDTRNFAGNPSSGWLVRADLERGTSGAMHQAPAPPLARQPSALPVAIAYERLFVDLRRYNRVSPEGRLNARLVLGGWIGGDDLPLERRFSLGGAGTLPGYDFRDAPDGSQVLACGGETEPGAPALCERVALAQVEYRRDVHVGGQALLRALGGRWWRWIFQEPAAWTVFADAGRGWLVGHDRIGPQYPVGSFPSLGTFKTDAGAGIDFGVVGLFVAKALSDWDESPNFLVRLRHRF